MECTIYLAEGCNLKCTYCYEGIDKKTGKMDIRTFDQTLAFIMKNRVENDKIHIVFLGGEPLLNKPLFFYAINKINSNYKEIRDQFKLEMTTNGVFLDDNVIKVVKEENINLSLSIDGEEHTQKRKNRKYCDGSGTHDKIIDNIAQFHEYENRTKMRMQATHVVTRNNYEDLYNSVKYLVEDLEMQVIDSALDLSVEWNYEQLDFIAKEWEKVIEYNLMRIHKGKPFMWGLIIDMQQYFAPSVCKGCGVGAIRIYVRTDGSIYGCASNLTETGYLGDVKGGLIIHKVKHYLDNEQECLKCNQCIFKRNCLAKICLMNRTRQENGDEIPNWVMCYLEEKKQTLWNKYKEYIRILV